MKSKTTCTQDFAWVKKTFEENDAGFQYVIDTKGVAAYEAHTQKILEKINAVKDDQACYALMEEWLHFFRKGHVWIESTHPPAPEPDVASTKIATEPRPLPHFK